MVMVNAAGLLATISIGALVAATNSCSDGAMGARATHDHDLTTENAPTLGDVLLIETGLVVFANAFSCGLTSHELRQLSVMQSNQLPVEVVLLADPTDTTPVDAAARDLGLKTHRVMSRAQFDAVIGQGFRSLPLFVVVKNTRPVVVMSDVRPRRLQALGAFLPSQYGGAIADEVPQEAGLPAIGSLAQPNK